MAQAELIKRYPSVLKLVERLGKGSTSMGWLMVRTVSLAHAGCIVALYWGSKTGRIGNRNKRFMRRSESDGLNLLKTFRQGREGIVECGNCVYDGESVWVWEKRVTPRTSAPIERLWIEEWQRSG